MDKKYFSIVPANAEDAARLYTLLSTKKFFPDASTDPALPVAYDPTFDYRQLLVPITINPDGSAIVCTRQEYTLANFKLHVITTAEWTARYNFSIAPTVSALPNYSDILANGQNVGTKVPMFLSADTPI